EHPEPYHDRGLQKNGHTDEKRWTLKLDALIALPGRLQRGFAKKPVGSSGLAAKGARLDEAIDPPLPGSVPVVKEVLRRGPGSLDALEQRLEISTLVTPVCTHRGLTSKAF